jgi:hypothetical protein
MAQMGRIGGPLLADNLVRNGSNLAFNTKVLYLDVTNNRVSFNFASSPPGVFDAYTPNAINTSGLLVDTTATISDFTVSASSISHATSTITISPNQSSNPTIVVSGLATDNLRIRANSIVNSVLNSSINITPTKGIIANSNVLVDGNLRATGQITFDGDITLGDNPGDKISLTGEINSSIVPTNPLGVPTFDLGSDSLRWNTLYANSTSVGVINQDNLTATTLVAGNLTISGTSISASLNNNLNLIPDGSGKIKFNGFAYVTNTTINNPIPTSPFIINNTQYGYTKFAGAGLVIPYGTSNNYPDNPELGTMRFNSSTKILEIYSTTSSSWIPVIGTAPNVTTADIERITFVNELILGF